MAERVDLSRENLEREPDRSEQPAPALSSPELTGAPGRMFAAPWGLRAGAVAAIARLQRTAGNAAVARALAGSRAAIAAETGSARTSRRA